jgi:hypothetical protein
MNNKASKEPVADAATGAPLSEPDDWSVVCQGCGEPRSSIADLPGGQRSPCPNCGSTNINATIVIHESLHPASDSISITLTPGDQERGWKRRWIECQRELEILLAPHTEPLSAASIHAARNALHAFFIQAYHLKDALIVEGATTGVTRDSLEKTIRSDPDLALLADLANLDKHAELKHRPKSGSVPRILDASAESRSDGWILRLAIESGGHRRDGLDVAQRAIDAWERELTDLRLI